MESYEYLTRVSQIPRGERLRSDSASCPDNIWGFPSYALREAIATRSVAPLTHVLLEPIFDDYWTPKAGQAFDAIEQEYHRIRYPETVVKGQVRMVRRRMGGGYFTILTPPAGATLHQARGVPQPLRRRRLGLEVPPGSHGLPGGPPRLQQRRQRL